jgi:nitroreductase
MLTAKGAWAYAAKEHKMVQVSQKDLRKMAGIFKAPIYIAIVSNSKLSGATPRSLHYATMDVGYVSQNIYLAAAGMKLGTCAIGSMPNPAGLAKELKLTNSEKVLLTHSVGIPE